MAENVNDIPEAVAARKSRRTVQLVWLIPLIAALVGGWLAVKAVIDRGPVVTISFKTAEGLEAGKSKLKFKDVDIGLVNKVALAPDLKTVIVTAELVKGADAQAVEDTQFWVVRPRISGGSVSGLSTLLSGTYIGVGIGKSKKSRRDFTGLEVPPVFSTDAPGREFVLHSPNLGSLDYGSPVFFRRLQVGQVAGYDLDKDGNGVTLRVFVNTPYDQYVNPNTRFWHASGVDVTLNSSGLTIDTQSVVSILVGGLAFETPATSAVLPPAEQNAVFELFEHRDAAMKNPDTLVVKMAMVFNESVRGLAVGAPVDFRGIDIGTVTAIKAELNEAAKRVNIVVEFDLYPARLRTRGVVERAALGAKERMAMMDGMVTHGLRAQLRTGNLLTGQLYIALDFFPNLPQAKIKWTAKPPEFPTTLGSLDDLRASLTSVMKKLDKVDFEGISSDLKDALNGATKTMERVDTDLAKLTPELQSVLADVRRALAAADRAMGSAETGVLAPDAPLQLDTREAMREIARAAQAVRILADYLEQHPEALISGKKEEKK